MVQVESESEPTVIRVLHPCHRPMSPVRLAYPRYAANDRQVLPQTHP